MALGKYMEDNQEFYIENTRYSNCTPRGSGVDVNGLIHSLCENQRDSEDRGKFKRSGLVRYQ